MKLALEVPEVTARRLEALARVSGKSVEALAMEGVANAPIACLLATP